MLANYHTHTARCGHAYGEDRAYVEAAIEAGMQVLGFSDHCPWVYPDGYESPIRMRLGEVEGYFRSLTALRDEYREDITIYIGFEAEYTPELLPGQDRLLADYPVDYQIMGQHYLGREPSAPYTGQVTADPALLHRYIDSCIAGMETGRYKYLAHPDLMGFCGEDAVYEAEFGRLCAFLASHGIPAEINQFGVIDARHYTDPRFLRVAAAHGCKAIIGCDAHYPEHLHHADGIARCTKLAQDAGLELVTFLPGLEPKA